MKQALPLLGLLLASCKPVVPPSPVVADPAPLVARAQAETLPGPVYATFGAVIRTPDQTLSVQGTLVIAAPDRFRVELRGPIGPAQVVLTCNGQDASVWVAPKNTFYAVPEANAALGDLLGGGAQIAGATVATQLLLGRLPSLPGEPTLSAAGSVARVAWTRPDGARFEAGIDSATAHLVSARATNAAGVLLLNADWKPGVFPAAMRLELPTLGVQADVQFHEWNTASPTDAAFEGAAPEGSIEKVLHLDELQAEKAQ